MDAVQLQYFKAVCETGSYSRAAEQLYISPQGISKAIHKLEDELGAGIPDEELPNMKTVGDIVRYLEAHA